MQGKIYRGINHKDESASDLKIKNNLKLNYRGVTYNKSSKPEHKSDLLYITYRGLSYKKIVS